VPQGGVDLDEDHGSSLDLQACCYPAGVAQLFYTDVLSALAEAGVPHVIVGGVAVNLQGVPRFTSDLDLALAVDGESLAKAAVVLETLGLRSRLPVTHDELARPDIVRGWIEDRNLMALTFVDPAEPLREVDLVIASPVPYDEIERGADRLVSGTLELKVASIDVLVRMKTGTGRAQDASDVDALRRVQETLRGR
jgi:hypothetical protein